MWLLFNSCWSLQKTLKHSASLLKPTNSQASWSMIVLTGGRQWDSTVRHCLMTDLPQQSWDLIVARSLRSLKRMARKLWRKHLGLSEHRVPYRLPSNSMVYHMFTMFPYLQTPWFISSKCLSHVYQFKIIQMWRFFVVPCSNTSALLQRPTKAQGSDKAWHLGELHRVSFCGQNDGKNHPFGDGWYMLIPPIEMVGGMVYVMILPCFTHITDCSIWGGSLSLSLYQSGAVWKGFP